MAEGAVVYFILKGVAASGTVVKVSLDLVRVKVSLDLMSPEAVDLTSNDGTKWVEVKDLISAEDHRITTLLRSRAATLNSLNSLTGDELRVICETLDGRGLVAVSQRMWPMRSTCARPVEMRFTGASVRQQRAWQRPRRPVMHYGLPKVLYLRDASSDTKSRRISRG
jgi:hypothetical protein